MSVTNAIYVTHRPDLDKPIEAAQLLGLVQPPEPPLVVVRRVVLNEPTVAEMAENFAGAMTGWVAAGFPVVSKEQYDARSAICERCEYWDGAVRFGLGKCKAPGCGCTSLKRWLATVKCTHPSGPQWPSLDPLQETKP